MSSTRCYSCHNCFSGAAREIINSKFEDLEVSLLGNEICEKVNVAGSFFLSDRVFEPRFVVIEN